MNSLSKAHSPAWRFPPPDRDLMTAIIGGCIAIALMDAAKGITEALILAAMG